MKITKVEVKNFRILENVTISLDDDVTLIVGRNNSGKTSLTEIFYKFFGSDDPKFRFEDFSLKTHGAFKQSLSLYEEYISLGEDANPELIEKTELDFKKSIPTIELNIHIEYEETDDLASLYPFMMDLDEARRDAMISCVYRVKSGEKLFDEFRENSSEYNDDIVSYLRVNYRAFYKSYLYSVDSQDLKNKREIERRSEVENVFITSFIYAQRLLDDQSLDNSKRLSKGFEEFYRLNKEVLSNDIKGIETLLAKVSENLDGKYKDLFKSIFNDLGVFGLEVGRNVQELSIKSLFDPEKVLKGNTQLFYQHDAQNLLPESYNGLGYSNLIFIILQFISFYEAYIKRKPQPSFQIFFVEEPEAHLHPQMQYVFIKNIKDFIRTKSDWNVQVVITTHSSHIISESGFENIRYFDNSGDEIEIRNLSEFKTDGDTLSFLKQYMSLNNCDMFFADGVIMVEGTVERLLLPLMIRKEHPKLLSKYLSIIEVGGAYAHRFKDFLEFINVKTLIITDIDAINSKNNNRGCKVGEGDKTSNAVLKSWIPKMTLLTDLLKCPDKKKLDGKIRVAYQIKEDSESECGRSFEEAFILRNPAAVAPLFGNKPEKEIKTSAYDLAKDDINKKTEFAFEVMMLKNWNIPKYIKEGLTWLEKE